MTRYSTTTVSTEADIRNAHPELGVRAIGAIRTLLLETETPGNTAVVWLREWLTDDKPLAFEAHPQVAVGVIERESDKAWQVGQPALDEAVWIPKSQARVFTLADGVTDIESKQRTLGDV